MSYFEEKFEGVFVDSLARRRSVSLLFKDKCTDGFDEVRPIVRMLAPQYALTVCAIDAATDLITEDSVANLLIEKVKDILSSAQTNESSSKEEQIYKACEVLQDSMLLVQNAELAKPGSLSLLQALASRVNNQEGAVRLRVLMIGDAQLLHRALNGKLRFISVKFYNLMKNQRGMDALLSKVRELTVGSRIEEMGQISAEEGVVKNGGSEELKESRKNLDYSKYLDKNNKWKIT